MTLVKFGGGVRVILMALIMLAAGFQSAQARTIFLRCGADNFFIDLTKGLVNNHPATINETAIDWQKAGGGSQSIVQSYHIDRTAGTFTYSVTVQTPNGSETHPVSTDSCIEISPPAAKF